MPSDSDECAVPDDVVAVPSILSDDLATVHIATELSPLVTVNPDLSPVSDSSPIVSSADVISTESDTLVDSANAHPKCIGHRCVFLWNEDFSDEIDVAQDLVVILDCFGGSPFIVQAPTFRHPGDDPYLFRFVPNGGSTGYYTNRPEEENDPHDDYVFMSQPVSEGDEVSFCLPFYDILIAGI